MFYLLKTEPSVYSFSDLRREKTTVWDGVTNPAAVKNLRSMKPHDGLIIYHTGAEKRAVGTATVESVEATDPKTPVVRVKVGAPLKAQPTLAEIKASRVFRDSPLVRQARLSVVPLTEEQYKLLTAA